jgi:GNAT superfamily N-acetyltransferase
MTALIIAMAVVEAARVHGVGTALIAALVSNAVAHFDAIALNVHLRDRRRGSIRVPAFRVPAFDSPANAEDGSAWG